MSKKAIIWTSVGVLLLVVVAGLIYADYKAWNAPKSDFEDAKPDQVVHEKKNEAAVQVVSTISNG